MKINRVELDPSGPAAFPVYLGFRDSGRDNPYIVKSIVGLDADEIVSRFYGGSRNDVQFHNLSLQKRDIVIRIALNPRASQGESFGSLRDNLYRLISASRSGLVQVQFKNDDESIAAISGFVTKMEAPQFEKNQEVLLGLKCPDPMLRAPNPVVIPTAGLSTFNDVIVDDVSTAPHGFKFEFTFLENANSFRISDFSVNANWAFSLYGDGLFLPGDILQISSEENDRYVRRNRDGNITQIADTIGTATTWPILFPGQNHFALQYPTQLQWSHIEHRPAYWGV